MKVAILNRFGHRISLYLLSVHNDFWGLDTDFWHIDYLVFFRFYSDLIFHNRLL